MDTQTPTFCVHRATPAGEGGIALFELYGDGATEVLRRCFRSRRGDLPTVGEARFGELVDTVGEAIDEAILNRIPAEGMWSRLEGWTLSIHGGEWIQERASNLLRELGGELLTTRAVLQRAVSESALDAIQAQAYELLLSSETEKGARFFLRHYSGEFSRRLDSTLMGLSLERVDESLDEIRQMLTASSATLPMAQPLHVLIAGRPNAGKSTLFNRLVEEERVVVSPVPGTTRDRLEETIVIAGYPVRISDSAGLRSPHAVSPVERQGIARARSTVSDAVLFMVPYPWKLNADDCAFLGGVERDRVLVVASMSDLAGDEQYPVAEVQADVVIAAEHGEGLDELRVALTQRWLGVGGPDDELPCAPFTPRQIELLEPLLDTALCGDRLLDVARRAYIQCRWHSWPAGPSPDDGRRLPKSVS